MEKATEHAVETIDAAIFSGDEFVNPKARAELRDNMARWERGLKGFDDIFPEAT